MQIAWLGTGLLGLPMAAKLQQCGYTVVAWNRTAAKTELLRSLGTRVAETPHEAMDGADGVCLMLQDANAIEEVLLQADPAPDLAERTVIQMGTIGPQESRGFAARIADRGGDYFEAPVLGSIPQAQSANLIVMAGATEEQFRRWRSLLTCLGPEPVHVGPVGSAATLKLALNQLIASLTVAFSVSLGMTRRAGIDVELFMGILRKSALFAPSFDKKLPRMLERHFGDPNFPTQHLLKDVRLIRETGKQLGLETMSLEGVDRILERALELGHATADYSSLYDAVDPPDV
jgi:3-hydroxyisobutyrate dehydrogenase